MSCSHNFMHFTGKKKGFGHRKRKKKVKDKSKHKNKYEKYSNVLPKEKRQTRG